VFYSLWKIENLPGQAIGALSGFGACLLWMMAVWFPASELRLTGISLVVALLMILASITAVIASLKAHGGVLIFLFVVSFFPVGLYLIGVPHWYRWIGIFNLGYLLAGVLIRFKSGTSGEHRNPGE